MKKALALIFVACFMLSAPVMGARIGIAQNDTRPEIGNRTYSVVNPYFVSPESVETYRATGVVIVDPLIGVEYSIIDDSLFYREGQTWYLFEMDRLQFEDCVVDLFYFEKGVAPFEINSKALIDMYNASSCESYDALYGKGKYPARIWQGVWNSLSQETGYLIQIQADNYTTMNILSDVSNFKWFDRTLEIGGLA